MAKRQLQSDDEDEFKVDGLIDAGSDVEDSLDNELADESEVEPEGDTVYHSAEEHEDGEPDSEVDGSNSDAEFNDLLGSEDDVSVNSSDFSDEPKEFINQKLSTITDEIHTKFSDGKPRIIKPEIDPVYDSDDSDHDNFNTIGNVPLSAYDEMPHVGYDINGKRIMRPAKGSALDQLLESIELPEGWTGLLDQNTGSSLKLTPDELELIKKIQNNENVDDNIDPYEPMIEWFTSKEEIMPLTAVPEPKRRFVPSKHEAKRIMKIVKAIREGRILPPSKVKELKEQEEASKNFDLWEDEVEMVDHVMNLRAPKLLPPTHEESYNPPEEYLFNEDELKEWEQNPEDRSTNFIPQKYSSLRKVPAYQDNIRERFERSLDLYLAPRVRHQKLNIDPDSLIPELPSPKDLRPFPIKCSTIFEGHSARIRTLSIHPNGYWLATGSDDGTVRVWEILTGREVFKIEFDRDEDDNVEDVEWNPDSSLGLLGVTVGEKIYLIVPPIFGFDIENISKLKIETGWGYDTFGNKKKTNMDMQDINDDEDDEQESKTTEPTKKEICKWYPPNDKQKSQGISVVIQCQRTVKKLSWHRKGDYFVTVSPDARNNAVVIHQISKHLSQSPFRKSKGIVSDCKFHPFKPQLFVAYQRTIKIYDLSQQVLIKKLMPGARWLSTIDIHPRGDNLLASSYDKRVLWHDLDLSNTPYKTLRYHNKAVRSIVFHKSNLPLFASASDDGIIHVFHGTVYDDLMTNPLLVPLKKLTGHKVVNSLGVLDLIWHPKEPWLFSAGADGTARLWTT